MMVLCSSQTHALKIPLPTLSSLIVGGENLSLFWERVDHS